MREVPDCTVSGSGDVLLFLHGLGGGAKAFAPQLDHFRSSYRTAAWDMPGYGNSVLEGSMTFDLLSRSLLALLDHHGWDQVHLVGHSLGGMVAQDFCARHQDRLLSLTLFATSPAFGRTDGEFQRKFVADRLAPLVDGGTMADLARVSIDALMPGKSRGRQLAHECMAAVPEATYRAALHCIIGFDRRGDLSRIQVPTLLIAGESDDNAPVPMMQKMASRIPGSRFDVIPAAGHLANLEDPGQFNDVLDRFLSSLPGVEQGVSTGGNSNV